MTKLAIIDMGSVWGGQEIYSRSIVSNLVSLGWQVTCISSHDRHAVSGCKFIKCSINYRLFPVTINIINSIVADYDVIHFNGMRAIYLSAFINKAKPFVGTKHLPYAAANKKELKTVLAHFVSRWVFRKIDWLISISDLTLNELPINVRKNSSVVLNGVSDIGLNTRPIGNDGRLRICFVGRFVEHKGLMRLLRAVALLREALLDIELVLAGSGPLEVEARQFVYINQLEERVTFAGYVDSPAEIYTQSHVCVLPSLHEGLPLSLLEALSAGCALVAHDIPGVRDIIKHEVNGLFAQATDEALAEALQRLATDRGLLSALRIHARADYLARWQLDRMVNETEAIYRKVIAAAARGVQP